MPRPRLESTFPSFLAGCRKSMFSPGLAYLLCRNQGVFPAQHRVSDKEKGKLSGFHLHCCARCGRRLINHIHICIVSVSPKTTSDSEKPLICM